MVNSLDDLSLDTLFMIYSLVPLMDRFRLQNTFPQHQEIINFVNKCQKSLKLWKPLDEDSEVYERFKKREKLHLMTSDHVDLKFVDSIVKKFSNLIELCMYTIGIDEDAIQAIGNAYPNLRKIVFYGTTGGDVNKMIVYLTNSCKDIQFFRLLSEKNQEVLKEETVSLISTKWLKLQFFHVYINQKKVDTKSHLLTGVSLMNMKSLTHLYLHDCKKLTMKTFKSFAINNGHQLKVLSLEIHDKFHGKVIEMLTKKFPNLNHLALSIELADNGLISSDHLLEICNLKNLETLKLWMNFAVADHIFNDDVLEEIVLCLKNVTNFVLLCFSDSISRKAIELMAEQWPRLEQLNFLSNAVDDTWCEIIAKFKHLKKLDISLSGVDNGLHQIVSSCRNLKVLDIESCEYISPELLEKLFQRCKQQKREFTMIIDEKVISDISSQFFDFQQFGSFTFIKAMNHWTRMKYRFVVIDGV